MEFIEKNKSKLSMLSLLLTSFYSQHKMNCVYQTQRILGTFYFSNFA